MILFDESLPKQVQKISDLASMLNHLMKTRTFCNNKQCCNLFSRYIKQVKHHMERVDKTVYSELLLSQDYRFNTIAENFMEGSVGVKRIIKKFNRKWWDKSDRCFILKKQDNHYYQFLLDVQALFSIIEQRLQSEMDRLYPAIEEIHAKNRLPEGRSLAAKLFKSGNDLRAALIFFKLKRWF